MLLYPNSFAKLLARSIFDPPTITIFLSLSPKTLCSKFKNTSDYINPFFWTFGKKYKIADLRSKLGLENTEYKTMSLFKANVLDKAVAEISSKSDLNIEYQQYKQGRIITHIQFKMKLKGNQPKENKKLKPKQMTAKQIDMYADKQSKLQSFQNFYLADAGQSLDDYRFAIVNKLQDEFYQKEWLSFLVETGFKPR